MKQYNKDQELKDVLITLSEYKFFLIKKKKRIFYVSILFLFLGITINFLYEKKYNAELKFVVENTGQSNSSLFSGIAGQFGLDVSQGGAVFSQQNILEILKSRGVVASTLLQNAIVDNKSDLLISHYLILNDKRDLLHDSFHQQKKFDNDISLAEDSILTLVWQDIVQKKLSIELQTNEANIISLSYNSPNQQFAKYFVEILIDEMSKMYIAHRTAQAERTLTFLKNRADSVFNELRFSEEEFAKVKDINSRIVKASGRLKELQLRREVEVLNTIYLEIVKNLELSKISLLDKTPIINIIDKPTLPLPMGGKSILFLLVFWTLLGSFLSICFSILEKLFQDALKDSL